MINYLLRLFLKLTNRIHLIQFFDGLKAIGKPGKVLYPSELLEQAALLGLSGLNNTLAIQSNQHWIWPYWVERQLNPETPDFIPTGVNLLTNNLSFRNWTALSIPGNRLEAMVDPVGMLTLEPFSWSVMPYLVIDDNYYIPSKMDINQVQQSLHKKNWPVVITRYKTDKQIEWLSKCKALDIDQQQVLQQKYVLKNKSDQSCTFIFGVSLRPYNSLTIGHIHKISCKRNLWKINGKPAMLMLDKPDVIRASNRLLGDPVYSDKHITQEDNQGKIKLKSCSGISTGIAAWRITLKPGERRSYQFLITDKQSDVLNNRRMNRLWHQEIQIAERHFKQHWKTWTKTGINICLPDKLIENAFYSVKNHLDVFNDVEQFTPGSFFYHTGWIRDSTFLSLGFDQVGHFDAVKDKFPRLFKQQTFKGYFKSQEGEWDSTGQALFSVITHIRRTGDMSLLKKYYPALLKGAKWIHNTRLKDIHKGMPHYGLLPSGLSAEHFGPNDHYYWDNFWSLSGIQQLIWCAQQLNKLTDTEWLQSVFESYSQDLQNSIKKVTKRTENKALPCSPYRWMDTAAIGNLAAIIPMNVVSKDEYWVRPSLEFLWQNNVRKGLFFQHIIHSGYNIYLSIQLAKILLVHLDPRWKIIFQAVLDAASPTWTWPEAIHPNTGGGCMGDGDHGWAAAEFVSLIRDMFVFEHGEALYLGAGLFYEWFEQLKPHTSNNHSHDMPGVKRKFNAIVLTNATTIYGTVSYKLKKENDNIIFSWNISRNALQHKVPVYFLENINNKQNKIQLDSDSGEYQLRKI